MKTIQELTREISLLKSRIRELERSEAQHRGAGEELRSSLEQLRLLIDAGPDFFFLKNLDLRYQLVNLANAQFFGLTEADIIGKSDFDLMPEDAAAVCQQSDRLAISEKRTVIATEPVEDKFYETYKFPFLIKGAVAGVAGIVRDITERRLAEEELRKSRALLSDMIENSGALICVKDRDGRYEMVNRKWEEVTGLTRHNTIGRTDEELFPGPTGKHFRLNDLEVMGSGSVVEKEEILEDDRGQRFFISIKFPLRDQNGAVTGMCAMITEITARKSMEEQLAISRDRLSRAEIISRSGNWEFHMETEAVFMSIGARRIFGVGKRALAIPDIKRIPLPKYRQMLDEALNGLIGEGRPYDVEFRIKRPDTGQIADIHSVAEYDRDRKVVFGIIQDITDRKHLESQLLQAKKLEAIGTLAGGIAHDFNNILMGIQGYASIMMAEKAESPSHPDYERLRSIEEQVKSASNLTRQLLGFARAGGYEIRPVDMNEIVRESSSMFHRTRKELTIRAKYERDLWSANVDRGQIEQVLLNLYMNAWHAMPAGGEIHLETANAVIDGNYGALHGIPPGEYVRVSIADTGMGMEEETMKRVFDPFFTTKEMGRGTGLGLAMVYGIMKGHKGLVDVRSKPGQGTTFTLYFPTSGKKVLRGKRAMPKAVGGSETILLVDDEQTVLVVTKRMLESLGYTVHAMDSGSDAVSFFKDRMNGIDLIMVDMIMPKLSGSQTFDRIRSLDPSAKVLLSSGYSMDNEARLIMGKGCTGFIQKPYNIAVLSRKVREVLER
ncbi:MAG: PAS domain-containing protein [Syntrophorhabdaceae bacterium]|nr:PAS domain-containing protein [Syntrophorhabdaceae bacterium]